VDPDGLDLGGESLQTDPLNQSVPPPPSSRPASEEQRPRGYRRRRTTLPSSTRGWSRATVWSLIGLTVFSIIYGFNAQLDSSITATGELRPTGGVAEVNPPFNSLIERVLVKEGQSVKAGQLLVVLREKVNRQQLDNVQRQRTLWRKRTALIADQLGLAALPAGNDESNRQLTLEKLEVELRQKSAREENQRIRINTSQARSDLIGLKKRLVIDQNITRRMEKLLAQGAISRLEVDRQHERMAELVSSVQRAELEVASSIRREMESHYKLNQIGVANAKELFTSYDNARQQLIEANSRVADLEDRLLMGRITASQSGRIFDLTARVSEVALTSRPVLKIIPQNGLEAEIHLTNKDIGWIKVGMPVEVRINSFPFTEYGSIKGTLTRISDDRFSADQETPQQYFKAKVSLSRSSLQHEGTDYPLRPGMSVLALVQIGSRPAISLVSDRFKSFIDSTRSIR
jgi:HlyD family secretion protein